MRLAAKQPAACKERAKQAPSVAAKMAVTAPALQRKFCACGGSCPRCQPEASALQTGKPNDRFEREADAVADNIMRAGAFENPMPPGVSPPGIANDTNPPSGAPQVLGSPGQPMAAATRDFFEPRFSADFSEVRLHTDATAAASAKQMCASAYTVGNHIVFGASQFAPDTPRGQHLLAHELTHVLQQANFAQPMLQRSEAAAGGCAIGSSAQDAGTDAHVQIRTDLRRRAAMIRPLEGRIPRADKGANGALVGTLCPLAGTAEGNVDLWYFESPFFQFAEVKPYTAHEQGLAEHAHYARRLQELESRVFGRGMCGNEQAALDNANPDYYFDANYLGGALRYEQDRRRGKFPSDDENVADFVAPAPPDISPLLIPDTLPAFRVPVEMQDAGPFWGVDPLNAGNLHLFYWNNQEDGTVLYQCRRKEEDSEESSREESPNAEQLALPLLVNCHPLLESWAESLQLQQVPAGSAYAVVVSVPIFNALAFGAAGVLPYSRASLQRDAGFEMIGEAFAVAGLALLTRGSMGTSSQGVSTGVTQGVRQTATQQIGQTAAQSTAQGVREMARANAARTATGTSVSGAAAAAIEPAEPAASTLSPDEARQESTLGRLATHFVPVVSESMMPKLYFVKTTSEQATDVPPPFAHPDQPDALGQVAWQAISALVPQEGAEGILNRRELGLLKNAIFFSNPAILGAYSVSPRELPEIAAPYSVEGYQYIVIAHLAAP